jgi:dipeptide/tripeptide permease
MSIYLSLRRLMRNITSLYIYCSVCSLLCRRLLIYTTCYLIYCLRYYNRLNQFIIVVLVLKNPKNIILIVLVCCVVTSYLNFLLIVQNVLIMIIVILIIKYAIICLLRAHKDSPVALRTRLIILIDLLSEKIFYWVFLLKSSKSLKIDF